MPYWLRVDADLACDHLLGKVIIPMARQGLVTIEGRPVLVEGDPVIKFIIGCPNMGATIKPCTLTGAVTAGYSELIFIEGHQVCLDTVEGLTDGTPPGTVKYEVKDAGQGFVSEES